MHFCQDSFSEATWSLLGFTQGCKGVSDWLMAVESNQLNMIFSKLVLRVVQQSPPIPPATHFCSSSRAHPELFCDNTDFNLLLGVGSFHSLDLIFSEYQETQKHPCMKKQLGAHANDGRRFTTRFWRQAWTSYIEIYSNYSTSAGVRRFL